MPESDVRIVRVTNIANFDFTPEMGAMYGGRPFPLRAGESMLFPMTVGAHLAEHLARQITLRKAPVRDASEIDGKGSDRPLWDETGLAALKAKIMTDVYEEERKPQQSEADRVAAKVAELNPSAPEGAPAQTGYQDKAEVIAELNKRDIKFDARASKATLEKLLTEQA